MGKGRVENLINPKDRTSEELREMTRKGGIKSGEVRRRKKTMREMLEVILYDMEVSPVLKQNLLNEGVDENDINHQLVINRSLVAKAEGGDVQAYNAICSMIGERPDEQIDLKGRLSHEVTIVYKGNEEDKKFPSSEAELDI